MDAFLRHIRRRMADSFGHSLDESVFHPEQIAQGLKDEEQSLFCFLNVQQLSENDLHRLRGLGFTQEQHRVLYCGPNKYLGTKSLPVSRISPELIEPPGQHVTEEPGHDEGIEAFEMDSTISPSARSGVTSDSKLDGILKISRSLSGTRGTDQMFADVLDNLFQIFPQADEGFVLLRDAESDKLLVKATKSRMGGDSVRISTTLVKQARQQGEAILSADAVDDSRFKFSESLSQLQIRSMMCLPLLDMDDTFLGIIQIDTKDIRRQFTQDDLDLMVSVASQASMALEISQLHAERFDQRDQLRELEVAAQIQRGFLPSQPPQVSGYEFSDFYEAAQAVGGDYFDYVVLPDGRIGISLGDVAGKGVPAALLMTSMFSASRLHLLTAPSVVDAVARLNTEIVSSGAGHRFVTCIMIVLDPRTHVAAITNAGHMAPLFRDFSGKVASIGDDKIGMPLGVVADQQFKQHQFRFEKGDSLVLFTDGIAEALNDTGDIYGIKRLSAFVTNGPQLVKQLVQGIIEDVNLFCGGRPQRDDMCLVAMQRTE